MVFIIYAAAAFLLFFLYDINGATKNHALLRSLFAIGMTMLIGSTVGIIALSTAHAYELTPVFAAAAAVMLGLLIYTLFFELPFKGAYVDGRPPLCSSGMYALCRHPGILWLGFMYGALYGALPCALTAAAAILFTTLDVLYALFQDLWTFPKIFAEYGAYRKTTPFLIPNPDSVKRAFNGKQSI